MTTIHRTAEFAQTAELAPAFLKRWCSALQERRTRARLRYFRPWDISIQSTS